MVYADFPYYQDFYCGTSITDAAAFRTAAARASEYIDNVTFGRLASNIPEPFAEPVKKCACALAEVFEFQRQVCQHRQQRCKKVRNAVPLQRDIQHASGNADGSAERQKCFGLSVQHLSAVFRTHRADVSGV